MMLRPKPALLVTLSRSGSTYLLHALSNHPNIFCPRDEPLHRESLWKALLGERDILNLLWNRPHYHVSIFKVDLRNALRLWKTFEAHRPLVKVIFLVREDILAQVVSHEIVHERIPGRGHSWEEVHPGPVTLDLVRVKRYYEKYLERKQQIEQLAAKTHLPSLLLTYEEITGNVDTACVPEGPAKRICDFLEVPVLPLCQEMHKVNPGTLSDWILNWDEILKEVGR